VGKTAYFDCFSGASGDMVLGALLDLGLPLDGLRSALGSLAIEHGHLSVERVLRAGVSAAHFRTDADPGPADAAPGRGPHVHAHSHTHVDEHGVARTHTHAHSHAPGPRTHDHGHDDGHRHDDGHAHDHAHPHDHVHGHGEPHEPRHGDGHGHHSLEAIGAAIDRSSLSATGKARARALFQTLAEAEAAIHDVPLDRIHLHEVGALDSIIDIVGAVYGFEWLGVDEIVVSPLNVGSGTVRCAHGVFPVPAPATARLIRGVPVYAGDVRGELLTPTGALLMTGYADRFGPLPMMRVDRIGYGAGSRDFPQHPNVLRVLVGETADAAGTERIVSLECEIDDMNPQLFGPLMDRLGQAGALDVFYTPVQMKKGRPGTLVTVLAPPDRRAALSSLLFAESTTIGVRYQELLRERLAREIRTVETTLGPVRFKVASRDGRVLNAAPEFDDCVALAATHGLPVREVQSRVLREYNPEP
jgi:uncharacterized protein (TIGR00299 family) protein